MWRYHCLVRYLKWSLTTSVLVWRTWLIPLLFSSHSLAPNRLHVSPPEARPRKQLANRVRKCVMWRQAFVVNTYLYEKYFDNTCMGISLPTCLSIFSLSVPLLVFLLVLSSPSPLTAFFLFLHLPFNTASASRPSTHVPDLYEGEGTGRTPQRNDNSAWSISSSSLHGFNTKWRGRRLNSGDEHLLHVIRNCCFEECER